MVSPTLESVQAPRGQSEATPQVPVGRSQAGALRLLVLRLHFYAAVLVAPFLLLATVSGLIYALSPLIEDVVDHHALVASSPRQRVPLGTQISTAVARHPDLTMSGVIPGQNGANTRVLFADKTLPSTSYQRVVFVDPADGSVHADTVQYGSSAALPVRTWISDLHRRLLIGDVGRIYSELAASWLAPLTFAGLVLWWDRRRRAQRRAHSEVGSAGRDRTVMSRPRNRRPLTVRRHMALGTWIALGLFVLSATGLTWSAYAGERIGYLRATLNWSTPALTAKPANASAESGPGGEHAGHDMAGRGQAAVPVADQAAPALAVARLAGLSGPVQMTPPAAPGAPWLVKETRHSWTEGPNAVSVDPARHEVVQRLDFASWPFAAKLTDWGIRIHMGFLFGLLNQLLLAALAVGLLVMIVNGYRMWWQRRPGAGFGRPPVRGAITDLLRRRPMATVAGAVLLVVVGWAVPLLGISLLGFLIIDTLIGLSGRGRAAIRPTTTAGRG